MKPLFRVLFVVASLGAGPAWAADVSRLEWGDFTVDTDSSNGYQEITSTPSDDGLTLAMAFSALEAKADGGTMESSAFVTGHYTISQPRLDSFATAKVTLKGHIIKSTGAAAKITLTVGGAQQVIEWPEGGVASEKFEKTVDVAMPVDGQLPNPFPVGVQAIAKKTGYADAVYVSVSDMTITAVAAPKVASN